MSSSPKKTEPRSSHKVNTPSGVIVTSVNPHQPDPGPIDELLLPLGFKRKGNNWFARGQNIERFVNLQRSQYGNAYYINYGYNLATLPLQGFKSHVEKRLGSSDKNENRRIVELLDLDSHIAPEDRFSELKQLVQLKILQEMQSVETESDIRRVLKLMPYRYTVPPFVLEHFGLSAIE